MPERDYYEMLGVARDATPEAIKKAYRGWRGSIIPTSTRATRRPRPSSRKSSRLTTSCPTQEKRARYDRYGRRRVRGDGRGRAAVGRLGLHLPVRRARLRDRRLLPVLRPHGPPAARRAEEEEHGGAGIFEDLLGRMRGGRPGRPRSGRDDGGPSDHPVPHRRPRRRDHDRGPARRRQAETLVVKIPPGIETGAKLRLKGQGEPGAKGARPAT